MMKHALLAVLLFFSATVANAVIVDKAVVQSCQRSVLELGVEILTAKNSGVPEAKVTTEATANAKKNGISPRPIAAFVHSIYRDSGLSKRTINDLTSACVLFMAGRNTKHT